MACVVAMLLKNQIVGIGFRKGLMFIGNYKPISA